MDQDDKEDLWIYAKASLITAVIACVLYKLPECVFQLLVVVFIVFAVTVAILRLCSKMAKNIVHRRK